MYSYEWDEETGGLLLNTSPLQFSKEPRPVYYRELDILGFDKYWNYEKDDTYPYMWAEANNYWYRGRKVAKTSGGALYTAPEIVLIEDPEPDGTPLRFVDIPKMVEKNREIMESLVQETIKKVFNTYNKYKKKIDVFYVAFSGGKDSVVTLDIVQRALPHNEFKVLFGDTGMEFPDTYDVIDKISKYCKDEGIEFLRSKAIYEPKDSWNLFGPPAQKMRWCCSVHKTAPQIMLLREHTNNPHFRGMALMGVRAEESANRSKYEEINIGKKHKGQYDFYPIFLWNSAELFIYIYQENLVFNETYKKGNSRAGCLVCPMEATKNTWFKEQSYSELPPQFNSTKTFNDIILNTTIAKNLPSKNVKEFMEIGVWKSRHNGKKLLNPIEKYEDYYKNGLFWIKINNASTDWKEWLKTVGAVSYLLDNTIEIIYMDKPYRIHYKREGETETFTMNNVVNNKESIYFMSILKSVFRKSAYCVTCQVCVANCPHGYITMEKNKVKIDDRCVKCQMCHKIDSGCLMAASHLLPQKESVNMGNSIDRYKNMGVRYDWVKEYFKKKDDFWENNALGSVMITSLSAFLYDCKISDKKKITDFGKKITDMGVDSPTAWGLMLSNLAYTSQFNWWIKNIDFNTTYTESQLRFMLKNVKKSDNSVKNIISGYKFIFYTNPILNSEINFGKCNCEKKGKNLILLDVSREAWLNPDPNVILYSLYKFAEACGDYYSFTLSRLLDHEVDSDGVSPTQIFGLDKETMKQLLTALSVNHPEFISVSFTLGLDNITLKSDKTSNDVLALF